MSHIGEQALEIWEHAGFEYCAIVPIPHLGIFNGYVKLPDDHPMRHVESCDHIDVDVHRGLTYGPDEDGWVGFDTAHAGDYWAPDDLVGVLDAGALRHFGAGGIGKYVHIDRHPMANRWTLQRLRNEVNHLAEQLAALTAGTPTDV